MIPLAFCLRSTKINSWLYVNSKYLDMMLEFVLTLKNPLCFGPQCSKHTYGTLGKWLNLEGYDLINNVMDLQSDNIAWMFGTLQKFDPVRRRPLVACTWGPYPVPRFCLVLSLSGNQREKQLAFTTWQAGTLGLSLVEKQWSPMTMRLLKECAKTALPSFVSPVFCQSSEKLVKTRKQCLVTYQMVNKHITTEVFWGFF